MEAIAYEPSTIREEIVGLFESTGLRIGEYARLVGISDSSVKNILTGTTAPSVEVLRKLAMYHKVAFLVHGRRRMITGRFECKAKGNGKGG
jgi:transcriptional regulator with XRE-family HTH domain